MLRRIVSVIVLTVALTAAQPAHSFDLKKQVSEFSLPNGMKWLVVRRAEAPVFSGIVIVRAGGADEEKGKTGIAHMFEHMAFKGGSRLGSRDWSREMPLLDRIEKAGDELTALRGSGDKEKIAALSKELATLTREADEFQVKNEVWEVMMRNGAHDLNAYTSKDLTAYHASMPVTRLGLWAMVMSELIFEPAFREFYTERSVVSEERRTSVENSPEGALSDRLLSASFKDGPYSFSTIGFDDDVSGLTIADAKEFHKRN
ncbi:MAG: insulinase family protein, partial [bacterium]